MKKKLISFLIAITVMMTLTVSTVVASGLISPELADEDDSDVGSITPMTINEYV